MTAEDRFVNPLGFQVVHYRPSEEVLSPSVATRSTDARPDITVNDIDAEEPSVDGGQPQGDDENQPGIRSR